LNAFAFIVTVLLTRIGHCQTGELSLGSLPSNVYRIVASLVVVLTHTHVGSVYVPAAGVNVGVDTVPWLIQKLAAALSLSDQPVFDAIAFIVPVSLMVIADEYIGELAVGSDPSVV